MTWSIIADWLLAGTAVLCALLQWASFALARRREMPPLLVGGRALLLAGWSVAAGRMVYLIEGHGDLPLPEVTQLWIGLLELGTLCVTAHWVVAHDED